MLPPRAATGFFCCLLLAWTAAPAKVEVSGVRGKLRDNVMAHLTLAATACDAPSWRVRRLTRKADPEIREALEAYGYYNPTIRIDSSVKSGCWLVNIGIEPGEPVRLRKVDVAVTGEAAGDREFQRLLRSGQLAPGDQLDHADYERLKKALGDLARQRSCAAHSPTASMASRWSMPVSGCRMPASNPACSACPGCARARPGLAMAARARTRRRADGDRRRVLRWAIVLVRMVPGRGMRTLYIPHTAPVNEW